MREFDEDIVKLFTDVGRIQGVDESISTLFANIYMQPGEISLEELAKKTGYSLPSISNKVHFMESAGILKRFRKPGSKKIYIHMEKDYLPHMKKQLVEKHLAAITYARERLPPLLKKYEAIMTSEQDLQQFKLLSDYNRQLAKADKLIKEIIALMDRIE